ncbi:MAG: DNA alkylation repair protein [Candidatus Omnitrophica bacterium]|nr:DNA alkylation repair protein [Candidatus Omnitrophota bacterium]
MNIEIVEKTLRQHADKKQAKLLQRFFKTGPGQYAEGDIFLGIKVPVMRRLAKKFEDLPLESVVEILQSPIHEMRFLALIILISQYHKADDLGKEKIYRLYLSNTKFINNWDLVDVSAKHIVGGFLMDKDKVVLSQLARSTSLWERRIAILATFYFIGHDQFEESLKIAQILLLDKHDLIHKAVGWMLREVGKKDIFIEEKFLKKHCSVMPRTMLRYAIERFPEPKRQAYLKGV